MSPLCLLPLTSSWQVKKLYRGRTVVIFCSKTLLGCLRGETRSGRHGSCFLLLPAPAWWVKWSDSKALGFPSCLPATTHTHIECRSRWVYWASRFSGLSHSNSGTEQLLPSALGRTEGPEAGVTGLVKGDQASRNHRVYLLDVKTAGFSAAVSSSKNFTHLI